MPLAAAESSERPQPAAPAGGWLRWVGPLLVVAVGLAAYANAFRGPFVFDDVQQIRDNPMVRDLGTFLRDGGGYRSMPGRFVAYLTFALDYRLGGGSPFRFHAFNVAVHLANALLVHALVVTLFRTPRASRSAIAPASGTVAFVAAVLFVAHPIQTQAVTYIVQRVTSLATLFYLASVVLYARWRLARPGPRPRRLACYLLSLLAAVLAMHTKEIAFTLPLAIALLEVSFFDRRSGRWLALVPFAATALLVPLMALRGHGGTLAGAAAAVGEATRIQSRLGRLEYLATELPVIVTYLFLLLLPVGQNLDHDYPLHRSLLEPEVVASGLVLLALAGLAVFLFLRTRTAARSPLDPGARVAAFGIGWWFVTLSVESTLVPIVDVINEHRVYLPAAGAFTAAAIGILFLARRVTAAETAPRATAIAGAVLALVLAVATAARNQVWASDLALWTDSAIKSPDKARPTLNLGTALIEAGRMREAVGPLRRAVALDPSHGFAHAQLAAALLAAGRPDEAEPELRDALRLSPADPEATFNLAVLLWQSRRPDEARRWFRRFLEIAPASYADARRFAEAHAAP